MTRTTLQDEDFDVYRLTHRAMSREVDAIARMIDALAPQDRVRPRRLQTWLRFVERTLHHHHHAEDRWFFPLLRRKAPEFVDFEQRLEWEHGQLDPLLRQVTTGLGALCEASGQAWEDHHARTREAAGQFARLLSEHLAHEEEAVVALSQRHLRPVDIETFNRRAFSRIPVSDQRTVLPWLFDHCTPAEQQRILGRLPLTSRLAFQWLWRPRFRALTGARAPV
jgi:hemerythrin-like domain-containing protein